MIAMIAMAASRLLYGTPPPPLLPIAPGAKAKTSFYVYILISKS